MNKLARLKALQNDIAADPFVLKPVAESLALLVALVPVKKPARPKAPAKPKEGKGDEIV